VQASIHKAADRSAHRYNEFVADEEEQSVKQPEAEGMTVMRPDLAPFRCAARRS